MATLSLIPEGQPGLTTCLNELLQTKKPQQQNNAFWLPTPESLGEEIPLQTRILKKLNELKEKKTKRHRQGCINNEIPRTI